ncbi:MAG: hypothetical protein ABIO46_09585 [Chitinophagales bacterium]
MAIFYAVKIIENSCVKAIIYVYGCIVCFGRMVVEWLNGYLVAVKPERYHYVKPVISGTGKVLHFNYICASIKS